MHWFALEYQAEPKPKRNVCHYHEHRWRTSHSPLVKRVIATMKYHEKKMYIHLFREQMFHFPAQHVFYLFVSIWTFIVSHFCCSWLLTYRLSLERYCSWVFGLTRLGIEHTTSQCEVLCVIATHRTKIMLTTRLDAKLQIRTNHYFAVLRNIFIIRLYCLYFRSGQAGEW